MIKKFFLILVLSCIVVSCGKKGDPVYGKLNQNSDIIRNIPISNA